MATVGEILSLGWKYHQAGDLGQAEPLYRRAMQAFPDNADAWYLCGVVCQVTGRVDEAAGYYREALRLRPDYAEVHNNLGVALAVQGNYADAVPCYQRSLSHKPQYPDAHNNLGLALTELGRLDDAIETLREAVRLRPVYPEACYNLGNALQKRDRFDEAVAAYEQALGYKPDYGEVLNNLGAALTRLGKLDEAIVRLQQARAARPQDASVLLNLGNALKEQGKLDEALACYRQALELPPESAATFSNYLFCLNYDPRVTPAQLFEEHRRWDRLHGEVPDTGSGPAPVWDSQRRLRVGYVSPDLYFHAAARFIESFLTHHDPEQVETFCYAEVGAPDEVTARLRALAHQWRPTLGLSDLEVVERIRADGIDILVDLAGHTAHNRLRVFAYEPAPVQVTYLGYPNTTGLRTMDYRLTDAIADPPGEPICHTEELIRLPGCFCCYTPPAQAPEVSPLPAQTNGYVTFGCLQNLAKLNGAVLDLWCELLRAIPTARLLVFRHTLKGEAQEYFRQQFARRGISAAQLQLRHIAEAPAGFLGVYRDIDISLDPFPWNGHTTACESLWMGVPVLTLYGNRHAGRMAASVLHQLNLGGWVARTPAEYIERAVQVARHWNRLSTLRAGLRDWMRQSPLCDGKTFTRGLEQVYRDLCRQSSNV
jgi:predicted O-linked N-acetylglucosamine transferase (SPINDLY family)